MVTENLQQIKVSVSSLVVRNGIYQAVLEYYDENGILTMNIYDFLMDEKSLEK